MEDAFDSPMCDIGSRNAAALALSRALQGVPVRICPHESAATATVAEINGRQIPLPPALDRWLRHAIHGLPVKPRCFCLHGDPLPPGNSSRARGPRQSDKPPATRSTPPATSAASTRNMQPVASRITRAPRNR